VKRNLAPLMTCVILSVTLFGCVSDCTTTVHVGNPGATVTYTDGDGATQQATADSNGNVAVPCDYSGSVAPLE
jgi:hypothetical protein